MFYTLMHRDETYYWSQTGPVKTTVTGVEMFKKMLDHGEVTILSRTPCNFLD
jgi:translation elongation factor EF-Tu-like GTPase